MQPTLRSPGDALNPFRYTFRRSLLGPNPREALPEAVAKAERVREVAAWRDPEEPSPKHLRRHVWVLRRALAWDLDTPRAFRALFRWLRAAEQHDGPVGAGDLREMLGLLVLDVLLLDE